MAKFEYIARTVGGERTAGAVEAASEATALRLLDEQRLFPIRVVEQAEDREAASGVRVRSRDLAALFEQLSDLLRAGVPMLRAIETLARTNRRLAVVLG